MTGTADLIGGLVGAVLTLMVFSYMLGDNPLFRFAIHLLIGVSAGLAAAVAIRSVILPQLIHPLFSMFDGQLDVVSFLPIVPLLLSLLLLSKLSDRIGRAGNVVMAFLVGTAAAAVVGGGLFGTLFPQVIAATELLVVQPGSYPNPLDGLIDLVSVRLLGLAGTILTLIYFQFGTLAVPKPDGQRPFWLENLARAGHLFIAVTFGAIFAGVFAAAIAAFIERWSFLLSLIFG
jgi:hypothetical protein